MVILAGSPPIAYIVDTMNRSPAMSQEPMHEIVKFRLSLRQKQAMTEAARRRGQRVSALLRDGAASLVEQVAR